jgi:hypothetical protein
LKDVGVEAAKAIKRDTEKVAEKVGIKSPNWEGVAYIFECSYFAR